jgi:hypothetical protein
VKAETAELINARFDKLGLAAKNLEPYPGNESYAKRFQRCTILEYKSMVYSGSTSPSPRSSFHHEP